MKVRNLYKFYSQSEPWFPNDVKYGSFLHWCKKLLNIFYEVFCCFFTFRLLFVVLCFVSRPRWHLSSEACLSIFSVSDRLITFLEQSPYLLGFDWLERNGSGSRESVIVQYSIIEKYLHWGWSAFDRSRPLSTGILLISLADGHLLFNLRRLFMDCCISSQVKCKFPRSLANNVRAIFFAFPINITYSLGDL